MKSVFLLITVFCPTLSLFAASGANTDSIRAKVMSDVDIQSSEIEQGSNNMDDDVPLCINSTQSAQMSESDVQNLPDELYYTLRGIPTRQPRPGHIYIYKRKRIIFNK